MAKALEHSLSSWKGQALKHDSGLIDSLDARLRVLFSALFSLLVVSSQHFLPLLLALVSALLLAVIARLNLRRTLRRVLAMDLFIVFLLLLLPFTTPGTPLFVWQGLTASVEGLQHALLIALKANSTLLCLLALLGTLSASELGHALARLKVPEKLVHLLLFTVRYLEVIGQEYKRMRRAMQARAFVMGANRHTWRAIGYLVGMLLVRSLERSERIQAAMKCRGFSGRFYLLDSFCFRRRDRIALLLGLVLLLGLAALNTVLIIYSATPAWGLI